MESSANAAPVLLRPISRPRIRMCGRYKSWVLRDSAQLMIWTKKEPRRWRLFLKFWRRGLLRCHLTGHLGLLVCSVLLVDEALLCSHINGLLYKGHQFCCFFLIAGLRGISKFAHHGLHVRLVWLQAGLTVVSLACALCCGLCAWHRRKRCADCNGWLGARQGKGTGDLEGL